MKFQLQNHDILKNEKERKKTKDGMKKNNNNKNYTITNYIHVYIISNSVVFFFFFFFFFFQRAIISYSYTMSYIVRFMLTCTLQVLSYFILAYYLVLA